MNIRKSILGLAIVGSLAATSAIAQNNNTGQITIQGVVPGTWEISVYDINSGYDLDLTQVVSAGITSARVGTINIYTNANTTAGGTLIVESANSGRLINESTGPGIAAEHQAYLLDLTSNALVSNGLTDLGTGNYITDSGSGHDLLVPMNVSFGGGSAGEALYDVLLSIPTTTIPEASGVYTDTLTFTIMDDN